MSTDKTPDIAGRNGVVITHRTARKAGDQPGYRTYEVYQRERPGESTEKIKAPQLISDAYRTDPYPLVTILRENYPCYRDWLSNCYWLTRYDDATSVFADDANFETRSGLWRYGAEGYGRDLNGHLAVYTAEVEAYDAALEATVDGLIDTLRSGGHGDLATQFAAALPLALLAGALGIPASLRETFAALYWRMHRGTSWQPALQRDGRDALDAMTALLAPLVEARRTEPAEDLLSVLAGLALDDGPVTAADVAVTLLERDHETLHGALANLWYHLLTQPGALALARSEQRLMKLAYLETLRHSPAVIAADRFARHEVERFGRLLPTGARVVCSAAAANRDPRVFDDPDNFVVDRRDMCQREPRGQYRADGLASGIAFGLGKPSVHPAVPEDRPRSRYALTRDLAVAASMQLVDALADLRLAAGAAPRLQSLTVGEMHTCWSLPVEV